MKFTEPNQPVESTIIAVTDFVPSSTLRPLRGLRVSLESIDFERNGTGYDD